MICFLGNRCSIVGKLVFLWLFYYVYKRYRFEISVFKGLNNYFDKGYEDRYWVGVSFLDVMKVISLLIIIVFVY